MSQARDSDKIVKQLIEEGLSGSFLAMGLLFFFGVAMILVGFGALWWNEGVLSGKYTSFYNEVLKNAETIQSHDNSRTLTGKVVHLAAPFRSDGLLSDDEILKPGPWLKIERYVEMYQWRELRSRQYSFPSKSRETIEFRYEMGWDKERIPSERFQNPEDHLNPPLAFANKFLQSNSVQFGPFGGENILSTLPSQTLKLEYEFLKESQFKIVDNYLYRKDSDPSAPKPGDIRIFYKVIPSGIYSVVARQLRQNSLGPIFDPMGKALWFVEQGKKSAPELLANQLSERKTTANNWRYAGFSFIFIGSVFSIFAIGRADGKKTWSRAIGKVLILTMLLSVTVSTTAIFLHHPLAISMVLFILLMGFMLMQFRLTKFSQNSGQFGAKGRTSPNQGDAA